MRISTGTILEFDVSFKIPVNNVFDHITVTDALASGLSYVKDSAPATLWINGVQDTDTTHFTDNSTPTTGTSDFSFQINNPVSIRSEAMGSATATIKIPVLVSNVDDFITAVTTGVVDPTTSVRSDLNNTAIITAYNAADVQQSQDNALIALNNFVKCTVYGFGSAHDSEKSDGKPVFLIAETPGVYSLATDKLTYQFEIEINPNINVPADTTGIQVYVGSTDMTTDPDLNLQASISGNTVTVKVNQIDEMKTLPIYVIIPSTLNANVETITDTKINSDANLSLIYTDPSGTENIVCTSPEFNITTNLTPVPPSLSGFSKLLV